MAETFSMLNTVKDALGETSNYNDSKIQFYIDEVNEYLLDAGVDRSIINTKVSAGVVARGVSDLWNYGAGNGKLSPYFYERAIQLACKQIEESED